jgi:hypothetical protein
MSTRVFTARFPGRCHADCGESIEPGDDATYVDDQIVHLECAGAAELDHRRAERPAAICPTCHLAKPCDCETP